MRYNKTVGKGAIQRSALRQQLAPILMTPLVIGLVLLPLAVESGARGCEIESPIAMVVFGRLVISTALNLLVLVR